MTSRGSTNRILEKLVGKKCFTLSAVSVCISFSEYLEQCLGNRKQFDNWVIVTVPDDKASSRLCKKANLDCCITQDVSAKSLGFHAAHNKSRFINAGLRYLRGQVQDEEARNSANCSWIIIIDADVMLPRDFRERLEVLLPLLDPRKLYGTWGRRVVSAGSECYGLMTLEPWEIYLERHKKVIGYFTLFNLRGPVRCYPSSPARPIGHDDLRFYRKFGPKRSARLPMTALHLGDTAVHWAGRVENMAVGAAVERDSAGVVARVIGELGAVARTQDAVLVGAWRAEVVGPLALAFQRVLVVDVRGLAERSRNVLEEADRAFLWRRFADGLAGFSNVFLLRDGKRGRLRAGLPSQ